ncbi:MAG TPA: NAD(P)H-quinone oxidoreductase [Candidatus Angelobacter sp.]|nr:NAD(P)H-quinone oxidoreductase [Candidatus Angelobacter sp.]
MNAMQAVWIANPGAPHGLEIRQVPQPSVAADQILVRVRASALNRADLLQRQGRYPAPPGFPQEIPGIEFAGEVAEVGPQARLWKPGQRVFGLTGGGAQAEYLVIHERLVAEIPSSLDWAQAASIPEVFITAHDALWKQADLRPGETVLIHAVGSGVGLAAVQLVNAIRATPYGTSRTPAKIEQAREFGLRDGLAVRENFEDLIAAAEKWSEGKGFDVVLDLNGGPYVKASQKLLATKGRMLLVGTVAGGSYELEARFVMGKRLKIIGTALRARTLEEKIEVTRSFAAEVVPLFAQGILRPVIDSKFGMGDIVKAHERLESNQTFGKVVVTIE